MSSGCGVLSTRGLGHLWRSFDGGLSHSGASRSVWCLRICHPRSSHMNSPPIRSLLFCYSLLLIRFYEQLFVWFASDWIYCCDLLYAVIYELGFLPVNFFIPNLTLVYALCDTIFFTSLLTININNSLSVINYAALRPLVCLDGEKQENFQVCYLF